MDEQIRQELAEIRQILRDNAEQGRQTNERLNRVAQQQSQFQDSLNDTRTLQQRNAEAISQQLEMISQMRQAMTEQNRQIQGNRADIARLDVEGEAGLN